MLLRRKRAKHLYSIVYSPRFLEIFLENEMPTNFTLFTLFTLVYTSKAPSVNAVTLIHYTLQKTRYVYTLKSQYFSSLDNFFRGENTIDDFYAASCVPPFVHKSSISACISSERHTVTFELSLIGEG